MTTKLVLAVIRGDRCTALIRRLTDAGFHVTTFSSIGGFLRRSSTTLMIGTQADQVDAALDILRTECPTPPDADEHSATIFVLNAGRFVPL